LARFRYPTETEAIVNGILASTFNEFGELAALRYQAPKIWQNVWLRSYATGWQRGGTD